VFRRGVAHWRRGHRNRWGLPQPLGPPHLISQRLVSPRGVDGPRRQRSLLGHARMRGCHRAADRERSRRREPYRRWDAGPNPGEGAGAGFLVLRGAHRTQHHSGAHQHIRRPTWLRLNDRAGTSWSQVSRRRAQRRGGAASELRRLGRMVNLLPIPIASVQAAARFGPLGLKGIDGRRACRGWRRCWFCVDRRCRSVRPMDSNARRGCLGWW
jgi:hypothetical protein